MIDKFYIITGILWVLVFCLCTYGFYDFIKRYKQENKKFESQIIEYEENGNFEWGKTEMPIMNNIYKGLIPN